MCYCEAIETYAKQCNNQGITIGWRVKTEECRELATSISIATSILVPITTSISLSIATR